MVVSSQPPRKLSLASFATDVSSNRIPSVSALALICAAWLSTFCWVDAGSDCSDKSHDRADAEVVLNHVVCDSS